MAVSHVSKGSPPRVLLVAMPWANPGHPQLGMGLLKAILLRQEITCDVLYANLKFMRFLSEWDVYQYMMLSMEGDLVFTPHYFDVDIGETGRKLRDRAMENGFTLYDRLDGYVALIDQAGSFLEEMTANVAWQDYDVIGFSIVFQQLCASLSMARRLKQRHPEKVVMFGGPGCESGMGMEALRAFEEIDFAFLGEADETIEPFVREVTSPRCSISTPGIAFRDEKGNVTSHGNAPVVRQLDDLPFPAFDDYFGQLNSDDKQLFDPMLYMECSRGCWWGEKTICTFCGLNGTTIAFRAKSTERIAHEIQALRDRYDARLFFMSDNILDHRAYKSLLPRLKELNDSEDRVRFFFEIKSNVSKDQVRALRDAGVTWVQPGIESFSDHVLKLMHKGCTGIQQVQLLKFLAEFSIRADWNILYANPGERPEDYDQMTDLVPYLHHLPPPSQWAVIPVAVQRFNRYHLRPAEYGITAVRPAAIYRDVFPREDIRLEELVYSFEYDHPHQQDAELLGAHERLLEAVDLWRRAYQPEQLSYRDAGSELRIFDRRADPSSGEVLAEGAEITLHGLQAEIYRACDSAIGEATLARKFADRARPSSIMSFVEMMVQRRLMWMSPSGQILSLALNEQELDRGQDRASHEAGSIPAHAPT